MEQTKNFQETVDIKGTRFIFPTHFNHQPDRWKGTGLYANVIVPEELVGEMVRRGIYVKQWPKEPENGDEIIHYVKIIVNYDFWQKPVVCLIMDGTRQADVLDDASISTIDELNSDRRVDNVNVRCRLRRNEETGKCSLYVQYMDVEGHSKITPYDEWYGSMDDEIDEDVPF